MATQFTAREGLDTHHCLPVEAERGHVKDTEHPKESHNAAAEHRVCWCDVQTMVLDLRIIDLPLTPCSLTLLRCCAAAAAVGAAWSRRSSRWTARRTSAR